MCVNINSANMSPVVPDKKPAVVQSQPEVNNLLCQDPAPAPADTCNTEQKEHAYIKIEPVKTDKLDISLDDKKPKQNTIQYITFVDSDAKDGGIKGVINSLTTIGPVKIDNISVPIPTPDLTPGDDKDKKKTVQTPVSLPGTMPNKDKDKIGLAIKVQF
jgi:hypothetical protein